MPRLLKPASYIEDRLITGGALVFYSAVLVQLLQVPHISAALWVALSATAMAIPLLVSVLVTYETYGNYAVLHETPYTKCRTVLGLMATLVCGTAVFCHFSWLVGAGFLIIAVIAFVLGILDLAYHTDLNRPAPDEAVP